MAQQSVRYTAMQLPGKGRCALEDGGYENERRLSSRWWRYQQDGRRYQQQQQQEEEGVTGIPAEGRAATAARGEMATALFVCLPGSFKSRLSVAAPAGQECASDGGWSCGGPLLEPCT